MLNLFLFFFFAIENNIISYHCVLDWILFYQKVHLKLCENQVLRSLAARKLFSARKPLHFQSFITQALIYRC